jgi:hypothetical protein
LVFTWRFLAGRKQPAFKRFHIRPDGSNADYCAVAAKRLQVSNGMTWPAGVEINA